MENNFDKWLLDQAIPMLSPSDLVNIKGGADSRPRRSRTRTRTKCCLCCGCLTEEEDAIWDDAASDLWPDLGGDITS